MKNDWAMEVSTAMRLSRHADQIITRAAELEGVSKSRFIRESAVLRAKRTVERRRSLQSAQIGIKD